MSELLGSIQDQTFARATAATASSYPPERRLTASSWPDTLAAAGDWVNAWIRMTAGRLLSYAAEGAAV